jgi:hypothetical protein
VATLGAELDQVTVRPVRTSPSASRVTAVACVVRPTRSDGGVIETPTLATGTFETVTVALPERPSTVAVMMAVPGPTAVTTPDAETVATELTDEVQVTVRPVRTLPCASRGVAVACVDWPTVSDGELSVTETLATGACVTVIVAVAVRPSLVAVICALPGETPVTTPLAETVAMPGAEVE